MAHHNISTDALLPGWPLTVLLCDDRCKHNQRRCYIVVVKWTLGPICLKIIFPFSFCFILFIVSIILNLPYLLNCSNSTWPTSKQKMPCLPKSSKKAREVRNVMKRWISKP